MPALTLALRTDEGALVIEALAELPFKHVYDLIGRLNHQANAGAASDGGGPGRYVLCWADAELIVAALGRLPYQRVHALLAALREQLGERLPGPA
ncbi:hypothetical protein [Janthinobacterium fluminis]|uniref:Uncharacterized protein n=1 Tax=Janthinobacterium fluminis TaxID=2987524 RepID=A0ABT5K5S3_9BURK|nr:hypothetical protein [Janthinobacterium fluminis]MDC8760340.1 hypothetical protein [Janthinobacterium fluminis]